MKHHPTCKTQTKCLVYHENGICPDANKCTCDGNYSPSYSFDKYKDTKTDEMLARQLHEWYLEATDQDGSKYNHEAIVPYDDLPEGSKLLDRYIAKKVIEMLDQALTAERERIVGEIERKKDPAGCSCPGKRCKCSVYENVKESAAYNHGLQTAINLIQSSK